MFETRVREAPAPTDLTSYLVLKISNEEMNNVTPKEYAYFVFEDWECKHSMWTGLYISQLSRCAYSELSFEVRAISILKTFY